MGINDINSLLHKKWNCKHHIVVDTVAKNESRIAEYIQNQLKEDMLGEQITFIEKGPFTDSK